ncbi:hypothetical protein QQS21_003041 [Conoideocrella luteorostrata]|uniref:holo-[acyl-carrier-protein] synthase n=1 Tax=Conoideocrella luteorostrata TaxID=1105319 RepID=A0AAJ0CU40_9HYPO|nr:hypothetical protein QQS21_003041 [Conoideocrella luteorostrata]
MNESTVIKWVVDTRPLWPNAKVTKDLATEAARAFALLTPEERTSVLKYHFLRDAKLALASALLKRHAITSSCSIPWFSAQFTRNAQTKPVFRLPDDSEPLIFNLSHQAGLVAMFAVYKPPQELSIGVDIVCPSERRDRDHSFIIQDGWSKYVDMHDSVFSPTEALRLRELPFEDRDRKLAYFYALWCLREGYVKMTGEALLADWLTELDLRYYAPPGEVAPEGKGLEIWFRGREVDNVDMKMDWYLDDYMICTAVKGNRDNEQRLDFDQQWTLLVMDELLDAAEVANKR